MKVLHVLAQMPCKTGSGVYYCNIINRFKKYGYTQCALFARQDDVRFEVLEEESQYPVCFKTLALPFPVAGMSDVMPYENTVYSRMTPQQLEVWRAAFKQQLQAAKQQFKPDVVILHHLWMLTSMAVDVFNQQVKIGICHNTDIRQGEKNPHLRAQYVDNLNQLDAVFALSDHQKDAIASLFHINKNKIVTVGGGFDETVFYPPVKKGGHSGVQVVYAGKIVQSKGVFELVKTFKRMAEYKDNIYLDIIGTPDEENAQRLKEAVNGENRIRVYPAENQKQLANHLRQKDIFVMPSFFEGLGLMALESLACGLWAVTTEIEGLMSLLGPKVNQSGAIEYVKMPRIYDTDKPCPEDLDSFNAALEEKLLCQIEKVQAGKAIPPEIMAEIDKNSWGGIVAKINKEMLRVIHAKNK